MTGNKQAKAEQFYQRWQEQMGHCKLVYTRTENGRKMLRKARKGSFDYESRTSQQQQAVSRLFFPQILFCKNCPDLAKVTGQFFYVASLTKRKYELISLKDMPTLKKSF